MCTTLNYKINHLFSSKRRKDTAQPTLSFLFSLLQMFLMPWALVENNTENIMFQLSLRSAFSELIKGLAFLD